MAIQDIALGAATTGAGGDTNREAFTKVNANFDEVGKVTFILAASDETTDLTTGTAKVTFRAPFAFTLTGVRASLSTAATGASLLTVDVNEGGVSVLGTKITIDSGELTSTTATTAATITDSAIADDASITVDIDQVGNTTPGKGLKVTLLGYVA